MKFENQLFFLSRERTRETDGEIEREEIESYGIFQLETPCLRTGYPKILLFAGQLKLFE